MSVTDLSPAKREIPGQQFLPGLILVALLAFAGYGLRSLPGLAVFSPMILGILVGMVFANSVGLPDSAKPGVSLAGKRLLRIAVALLGFQITLAQIGELGLAGVTVAAVSLFSTFFITLWLGRRLGVAPELAGLIAAGSSICGASAIAAAEAQIHARDEEVAYAVSCVTIFGTLAMFGFPILMPLLGLSPVEYGVWSGAAIHEVAQVVGAAFQGGEAAAMPAIVVKLSRVLMLAPLLIVMARMATRFRPAAETGRGPALVPFFLIGFVLAVILNSLGLVPEALHAGLVGVTPILLTLALTALGLGTQFGKLRSLGIRPLLLGGIATLWISGVALLLAFLLF